MQIQNIVQEISEKLKSQDHAWWLLETITNKTKSQLISENIELTHDQISKIDQWINKIVNEHYPIQYLIGKVPFLNCEILVESPILIPRSETEEWCGNLIKKLKNLQDTNISILDMCTGSGCIAIALAKNLPNAQITAVDISEKAIELTKKNIELNKVTNVEVIKSDLFNFACQSKPWRKWNLIVSNPPYIDEKLFHKLDLSVKNWEDPNALISKEEGLYLIKQIIKEAHKYLKENKEFKGKEIPNLVIEIDETQGQQVNELMFLNDFNKIEIKKDLQGKDRVVLGLLSDI